MSSRLPTEAFASQDPSAAGKRSRRIRSAAAPQGRQERSIKSLPERGQRKPLHPRHRRGLYQIPTRCLSSRHFPAWMERGSSDSPGKNCQYSAKLTVLLSLDSYHQNALQNQYNNFSRGPSKALASLFRAGARSCNVRKKSVHPARRGQNFKYVWLAIW